LFIYKAFDAVCKNPSDTRPKQVLSLHVSKSACYTPARKQTRKEKKLLKFNISNQNLTRTDENTVSAGSVEFLRFSASFSEHWNDYVITARCERDGETKYVYNIVSGLSYFVPHEMLSKKGEFFVSFFGVKGDVSFATAGSIRICVGEGSFKNSDASEIEPTPSLYSQLVETITAQASSTNEAARLSSDCMKSALDFAQKAALSEKSCKDSQLACESNANLAVNSAVAAANSASELSSAYSLVLNEYSTLSALKETLESAEASRSKNESERISNENERNENEKNRQALYNSYSSVSSSVSYGVDNIGATLEKNDDSLHFKFAFPTVCKKDYASSNFAKAIKTEKSGEGLLTLCDAETAPMTLSVFGGAFRDGVPSADDCKVIRSPENFSLYSCGENLFFENGLLPYFEKAENEFSAPVSSLFSAFLMKGCFLNNTAYTLSFSHKCTEDDEVSLAFLYTDGSILKADCANGEYTRVLISSDPEKTIDCIKVESKNTLGSYYIKDVMLKTGVRSFDEMVFVSFAGTRALIPVSLRAIPSGDGFSARDEITYDEERGCLIKTQRVGHLEFTGDEKFTKYSSGVDENVCAFVFAEAKNVYYDRAADDFAISSHFVQKAGSGRLYTADEGIYLASAQSAPDNIYIKIRRSLLADDSADSFKAWLRSEKNKGTPVTIDYKLQNETTQELLVSYFPLYSSSPETNVFSDDNKTGFRTKYNLDLSHVISELLKNR